MMDERKGAFLFEVNYMNFFRGSCSEIVKKALI